MRVHRARMLVLWIAFSIGCQDGERITGMRNGHAGSGVAAGSGTAIGGSPLPRGYVDEVDESMSPPSELSLVGKVVNIVDGDTIDFLTAGKTQLRIRFDGIDAPEKLQPFGWKATQFLAESLAQKPVRIVTNGEDRDGRTIGTVFVVSGQSGMPDVNLNALMVENGFAWHYVQYAPNSQSLATAERRARKEKRGLWVDPKAIAPWDWRRQETNRRKATQ